MWRPATRNLSVARGDDLDESFYIRTRDSQGNKSVLNLTGYGLEAKVTDNAGVVLHAITATFTDASQGLVNLRLARAVTATLAKTGLKWYVALITPSDAKKTYMMGQLIAYDRGDE